MKKSLSVRVAFHESCRDDSERPTTTPRRVLNTNKSLAQRVEDSDGEDVPSVCEKVLPTRSKSGQHAQFTYGLDTLIPASDRSAFVKLMALRPHQRDRVDLCAIIEVMERTSFAKRMPKKLQRMLACRVNLASCKSRNVVVKEGALGNHMYILISGSCNIVKSDRRGNMRTIRTIRCGEAFGELALRKQGGKRTATVKAESACEFLTLQGDVYRAELARYHDIERAERVAVFMRLPIFRKASAPLLYDLAAIMERRTYKHGDIVFKQGDPSDALFVLVAGSVRLLRRMNLTPELAQTSQLDPFLMQVLEPTMEARERFVPFPLETLGLGRPRSVHLDLRQHRAPRPSSPPQGRLATTATLASSDKRPRTALGSASGGSAPSQQEDPPQLWVELTTLVGPDYFGETSMLNTGVRHGTAVADSRVEVLVLSRVDFDLKASPDVRDTIRELVSQYPKDAQLLQHLNDKLKWERYKKRQIYNILAGAGKLDRLVVYDSLHLSKAWKP